LLEKLNSLQNPKLNTLPSSLSSSPSQQTTNSSSIPAIVSVKSATPEPENSLNHLDTGNSRKRKREDKDENTPILDIQRNWF